MIWRFLCILVGHVTPADRLRDGVIVLRDKTADADRDHWRRCIRCGEVRSTDA